jgi:hypothetical protein
MKQRIEFVRESALGAFCLAVVLSILFQAIVPAQFYEVGSNDFLVRDVPLARRLVSGQGIPLQTGVYPIGLPLIVAGIIQLTMWFGVPFEIGLRFFALLCMGLASAFLFLSARVLWGPQFAWITALFVWRRDADPSWCIRFALGAWSRRFMCSASPRWVKADCDFGRAHYG